MQMERGGTNKISTCNPTGQWNNFPGWHTERGGSAGLFVDGGVVLMLVLLLVWVLDEWDFLLDFDETLVSVLD